MTEKITRILSDLHYGDPACRLRSLAQINPLLEGIETLVLNGDTVDTRQGPYPERTAAIATELDDFLRQVAPKVVRLTGNHDPDFSTLHAQDLAHGQVLVTHGDILFDEIVPWGRDAPVIRAQIAAARAALSSTERDSLEAQLRIYREVCAGLEQRHQVERNLLKYLVSLVRDTLWPPTHFFQMMRAWREAPERAAAIAQKYRPAAKFVILGHLHRPGVWHARDGRVIINTGAFCRPLGACLVDLMPGRLVVRRIEMHDGAFHPGRPVVEFALAEA